MAIARPLSRDKADTLLLLVACCLVLAPHALHLPPWVNLSALLMLGWRAWITFRGNRMPPRWILAPIAVLIVPGVFWDYQTFFGRDAGVAMLVLLLTCKLLEMRARRDLFVVVCLCFFLMLTNLFYSQSIGTAGLMLVATLAILTSQLSFQYTGVVPPLAQRLRLSASILGLALPLTLVLFFLFPRIQGPLWGLPSDAQASHSGLSETMAPGNITNLALSEEVVFRVQFLSAAPARGALYWRGVVLGSYDGRAWGKLRGEGERHDGALAFVNSVDHQPHQITVVPKSQPIRYQVTLEPSNQRWLYALELPQAVPLLADNQASFSTDVQLVARRPITERVRYELASVIDFDLQPDAEQIGLQDWLELPPGFNPRTHALAARLRNQSDDNAQLIAMVLRMFRTQPFRYTLEPPRLGRDAVDDFLFSTRAGFCEHYASSFVVLMRALDIPARVVTGYQGGEFNPNDGFYTVRQSDAHAWAEVWLRGRGWVRIDPTAAVAPERIEHNTTPVRPQNALTSWIHFDPREQGWLATTRLRFDALNNGWNQWVLNYTPARQKSLVESLGLRNVDWSTLAILMVICGSAAVALVALPLLWRRSRIDPAERLYQCLNDRLARRGLARAPHEGPRAYDLRLATQAGVGVAGPMAASSMPAISSMPSMPSVSLTPTAQSTSAAPPGSTAPGRFDKRMASPALSPARLAAIHDFMRAFEALRYGPQSGSTGAERRALIRQLTLLLAQIR